MKYERLTKRDENVVRLNCKNCPKDGKCNLFDGDIMDCVDEAYNRLAELEDKIDDGRLVELPCKVGDKFYGSASWIKDYTELVCEGFIIKKEILILGENGGKYQMKYVSFSEEAAEAKLKELWG